MLLCVYVQPTNQNVEAYIAEFKKHHVTDLVRACDSTYSKERVQKSGVQVHVSSYMFALDKR